MVEWYKDSTAAIAAAKQHKGFFVAFVHDDSEASKGMQAAWESPVVDSVVSASPHIFCVEFATSSPMCSHFLSAFPQAKPPCTLVFDTVKRKTLAVLCAPSTAEELLDTLTSGCQREEDAARQTSATSTTQRHSQKDTASGQSADTGDKDDNSSDSTKPALEERKEALLAKMERAREKKRQAELEEEKRRETARREQAKAMQSAQRRFEEEQMKRIAAEKRKERMAEKKRRQEVLRKIQEDRGRKQQQQQQQGEKAEQRPAPRTADVSGSNEGKAKQRRQQQQSLPRRVPPSVDGYTDAVLSFRLPDGHTKQATFSADAEMREVFAHVRANLVPTNNPIAIRQPYPVKTFEETDERTLRALGLVPRARLLVQVLEAPPKPPSMCEWLWELVTSFFKGPPTQQPAQSTATATASTSSSSSREDARRRRVGRLGDGDDENRDAYNGNSTQFQF